MHPLSPGPELPGDRIDHLSMITPPPTPTIAHRQERPQPLPFGVRRSPRSPRPITGYNGPSGRVAHLARSRISRYHRQAGNQKGRSRSYSWSIDSDKITVRNSGSQFMRRSHAVLRLGEVAR